MERIIWTCSEFLVLWGPQMSHIILRKAITFVHLTSSKLLNHCDTLQKRIPIFLGMFSTKFDAVEKKNTIIRLKSKSQVIQCDAWSNTKLKQMELLCITETVLAKDF